MAKFPLNALRRVVRLHLSWLMMVTLGKDAIAPEEYEELRLYGKLPLESLDLVESSYLLGRLKSFMKSHEYKTVSYEKLKDEKKGAVYTESEKLAIEHARLTAASSLKHIADEITNGLYDSFGSLSGQQLSVETIRGVVRSEVVSALEERSSAQELASSLASKFHSSRKDWLKVARTELHRAKMMGVSQAIANRLGPYASGDGPDSYVAVIPAAQCCEDCRFYFLDENGNPRVFLLRSLLAAGSNSDPGTSHKKTKGLHVHWKATLPPLHPNCGCTVQYLPPGTGYSAGKMVIKSLTEYQDFISKAADGGSTGGVGNPVSKPAGPPQASAPTKTGSLPGVSQGTKQGTGQGTSIGNKVKGPKGPPVDYVPKDSVDKRPTGTIGETDSSYKVVRGMKAGKAPTDEQKKVIGEEKQKDAVNWSKTPKSNSVKLQHMTEGEVSYKAQLGDVDGGAAEVESGITEAYRAVIEGNGRALLKPAQEHSARVREGTGWTEGGGTVPHGRGAHHEAGAYHAHVMFGLTDHVPPTAVRQGDDDRTYSMQSWREDSAPVYKSEAMNKLADSGVKTTDIASSMIAACPADKRDALKDKLMSGVAMNIVLNHNDAHFGNVLFDHDGGDVAFIDSTTTGGTGLEGHKNAVFASMHKGGMKVRIPEKLNERFSKTTLHDMQRSMGGHYKDWQVGQSFLRMRYAQTLQERDGHLNYDFFQTTRANTMGEKMPHTSMGFSDAEYDHREANKTLPNDIFESWSKKYIMDVKANPDHPDHHSINEIDKIGCFMGTGDKMAVNPDTYRQSGKHRAYENTVTPRDPPKDPSKKGVMAAAAAMRTATKSEDVDVSSYAEESSQQGTAGAKPKKQRTPDDATKVTKSLFLSSENIHRALTPRL